MATKLNIDGKEWTYEKGAWRMERWDAWINVVLKTEYVVETLSRVDGTGEWITTYLTDAYGWVWVYDGDMHCWTYYGDAITVSLQYTALGRWMAWRTGFGRRVDTVIGDESERSLVEAIDDLHGWLAQLWGSRVGELVWDDELSAYVGSLDGWYVELYSTQSGWCAKVSDAVEVEVVTIDTRDPRAAYAMLEERVVWNASK